MIQFTGILTPKGFLQQYDGIINVEIRSTQKYKPVRVTAYIGLIETTPEVPETETTTIIPATNDFKSYIKLCEIEIENNNFSFEGCQSAMLAHLVATFTDVEFTII
jgi:hypothetical protein